MEEGDYKGISVKKSKSFPWTLLGKNGKVMDYGVKVKECILGVSFPD